MAVINFPDPAGQTPVSTFGPNTTPFASANGTTYEYTNGSWTIAGSGGNSLNEGLADTRYVNVEGDNMTGDLTLGPVGDAQVTLGVDGSADFGHNVFVRRDDKTAAPSATNPGAFLGKGSLSLSTNSATPASTNFLRGFTTTDGTEVVRLFANSDLYLGNAVDSATLERGDGNIQLNGSDGSASFAGGTTYIEGNGRVQTSEPGFFSANAPDANGTTSQITSYGVSLQRYIDGLQIGRWDKDSILVKDGFGVTNWEIKADGSATFAGSVTSGPALVDDAEGGIYLRQNIGGSSQRPQLLIKGNTGTNPVFQICEGGIQNENIKATISNDGSAYFAGEVSVRHSSFTASRRLLTVANANNASDAGKLVVTGQRLMLGPDIVGENGANITLEMNDGSATFASDVQIAGSPLTSSGTQIGIALRSNGEIITALENDDDNGISIKRVGVPTATAVIKGDGSAVFSNSITLRQGRETDDTEPALAQATRDVGSVSENQSVIFSKHVLRAGSSNAYMYWKTSGGGTDSNSLGQFDLHTSRGTDNALTRDPVFTLTGNGNASFSGTVDARGGFTINGVPVTVAVADANALRETFQELQVAVANATDFAGLKAAMLVALEDYAA